MHDNGGILQPNFIWRAVVCVLFAALTGLLYTQPAEAQQLGGAKNQFTTLGFGVTTKPSPGPSSTAPVSDDDKAKSLRDGSQGRVRQKLIPNPTPPKVIKLGTKDPNGEVERSADWLPVIGLSDGRQRCTGTAIGPRVVITAAHCVIGGGQPVIRVTPPIKMACTPHPSYRNFGRGQLYDYALCFLARDFPRKLELRVKVTIDDLNRTLDRFYQPGSNDQYLVGTIRTYLLPKVADPQDVLPSLENEIDFDPQLRGLSAYLKSSHNNLVKNIRRTIDTEGEIIIGNFSRKHEDGRILEIKTLLRETDVRFERLGLRRTDGRFRRRDRTTRRVLMTGYGCVNKEQQGGNKDDHNLRIGIGRISRFGRLWLTVGSRQRSDSAIICQGDSGGPAFRLLSNDANGPRRIIAINARNLTAGGRVANLSFLAKTSARSFRRFFARWRRLWGYPYVCGVDRQPAGFCHK